jgi:hypothetical protein
VNLAGTPKHFSRPKPAASRTRAGGVVAGVAIVSEPAMTKARIDRLLELGARLERPEHELVIWRDAEESGPGVLRLGYPVYHPDVDAFFIAVQEEWSDPGYDPGICGELLADDAYVGGASLRQLAALLTYCARGERFCDGHWARLLGEGRIAAILRRLRALRDES